MLMIVAHHFVVNSGLSETPMSTNPAAVNTIYLWLFGMWGKTGINCFLLITGYFMCNSNISLRKFVKLMLWIYFYKLIIFTIFLYTGYETLSLTSLFRLIMPVWGFHTNFTSCFIGFWLTIPFWNILIQNMTKKQHLLLLILLLSIYTLLGSIPSFSVTINYITWFGVIYLIASYIRRYPNKTFDCRKLWGWSTLATITLACLSMLFTIAIGIKSTLFFVSDSNKFFALAVAVTSFLWIKNINLAYNRVINAIGGSTFGVLLIHANSDAMRQWLWKDSVDCVGHYALPLPQLILFSIGTILAIFCVCTIIDVLRIRLFEKPFFNWYDKKPRFQKVKSLLS